jgi:hypothetical protein
VAEGAWRCSQCGTVNEPVANACRTCGRWPSLFELEGNTVEAGTEAPARAPAAAADFDEFTAQTVEAGDLEQDVFDPGRVPDEVDLLPEFEGDEPEPGAQRPRWRALARLIVPIGVVVYVLVTTLANRG